MDEDIRQLRQLANITTPEHDPTNPTSKPPSNDMPSSSSEKGDFASDLKPKDVKPDANSSFYYSQLANISTPGEALSSPTPLCMPSKPSIIFPIYIYPSPGAWDPLYNAISHNPSLHFIIIINPHNGPGESKIPDENYSTEIPKLNSYPNVTTLGYIALNYSHKKSLDVVFEVKKYAGWAKSNIEGLYVAGVFFDEVPNLWDHLGGGKKRQLDRLNSYVRKCEGIGGDRLVIYNPGTVPDPEYQIMDSTTPDLTVVAEQNFATYKSEEAEERLKRLLRYDREKCALIIHSVPKEEIGGLVKELKGRGGAIFVTDLCENVYGGFGESWTGFVEAMASEEG